MVVHVFLFFLQITAVLRVATLFHGSHQGVQICYFLIFRHVVQF
jgi:hypothetical protein